MSNEELEAMLNEMIRIALADPSHPAHATAQEIAPKLAELEREQQPGCLQ
jgi:hypothetical protein